MSLAQGHATWQRPTFLLCIQQRPQRHRRVPWRTHLWAVLAGSLNQALHNAGIDLVKTAQKVSIQAVPCLVHTPDGGFSAVEEMEAGLEALAQAELSRIGQAKQRTTALEHRQAKNKQESRTVRHTTTVPH
jgi:hypothetical protein